MESLSYTMPAHGWTCFHCGEHFTTPGGARDHFGRTPDRKPGCLIKIELGGERGLLMALRKAEEELARYREEDGTLHRELATLQSRHSAALQTAEETGYARGLRDAKKEGGVNTWQPIETAPKDGTLVLLHYRKCGAIRGYFDIQKFHKKSKPFWVSDALSSLGERWHRYNQPTRWMPLPADPEDLNAGESDAAQGVPTMEGRAA